MRSRRRGDGVSIRGPMRARSGVGFVFVGLVVRRIVVGDTGLFVEEAVVRRFDDLPLPLDALEVETVALATLEADLVASARHRVERANLRRKESGRSSDLEVGRGRVGARE